MKKKHKIEKYYDEMLLRRDKVGRNDLYDNSYPESFEQGFLQALEWVLGIDRHEHSETMNWKW